MKRRAFFWLFAALPFLRPSAPKRWGPVDVHQHHRLVGEGIHLHVWHRGEDITHRCFFADDSDGVGRAGLYKLNADGRRYLDRAHGRAAREWVTGIELRDGPPFS